MNKKRKTLCQEEFLKCELVKQNKELQQENKQLKKQYCERTDCAGRIGNSKKVEILEEKIQKAVIELKGAINNISGTAFEHVLKTLEILESEDK